MASAARYTAYRERAPKEVRDKLVEWGAVPEEVETILQALANESFIDSKRFSRAFCLDKFRLNKWGRRKIRRYLQTYDLDVGVIEYGLSAIEEEAYHRLVTDLAKQKWDRLATENNLLNKKQKTAQYLLQKGFEPERIWTVIRTISP